MKRGFSSLLGVFLLGALSGCSVERHYDSNSTESPGTVIDVPKVVINKANIDVPTLVIVMNWDNESEAGNQLEWHNKLFDTSAGGTNSVNRWYANTTNNNITLVPVEETEGTINDGVIMVPMGQNHFNPLGDDRESVDKEFRDTFVKQALESTDVTSRVDFASYDKDDNGYISTQEMQIIIIVAGGELSYGGPRANSIWAHAWNFDDATPPPSVNGITLLAYSEDKSKIGSYATFGAEHRDSATKSHKATIGIMAHEIGHSLYNLPDLYDLGNGSGLGAYDIMSDGAWGENKESTYAGEVPTQFSTFNKIKTAQEVNVTKVSGESIDLKCSANEFIKLPTAQTDEYFLIECRDTQREDSDSAFTSFDPAFPENKLVAVAYHVDESKLEGDALPNSENGKQTSTHHYAVRVVERDSSSLMTAQSGIQMDYRDVYTEGEMIDKAKLSSYLGETGFYVEVRGKDTTNRTMNFRVSQ